MHEFLNFWQHFYNNTNRIALDLGFFKIYYYALCYIAALLLALFLAQKNARKFNLDKNQVENYFLWLEIGIILGARLGFILIYSENRSFYLTHPLEIFNPIKNGEFVGISGMSYHGAIIGAFISTLFYAKKHRLNSLVLLDLVAYCAPLAYTLGRIGNFLNHELFGRITTVPWGVYVGENLRHPSQLYEAFSEGILLYFFIKFMAKKQKFSGELICLYAFGYSFARFVCEFFREPDFNLGFIALNLSMGQILCLITIVISLILHRILRTVN